MKRIAIVGPLRLLAAKHPPQTKMARCIGAPFFVHSLTNLYMFQRRTGPVSTWMKFDLRLYMPTPPRCSEMAPSAS